MQAGFGLGRLHHIFSRRGREAVVFAALDAGFAHFDLAPAYGDGLTERELGRMLGARRAGVRIATKFGIPFRPIGQLPMPVYFGLRSAGKVLGKSLGAQYHRRDFGVAALRSSLEASLRRLRTEYVDLMLVHEPLGLDQFRTLGETWAELEQQQRTGKIRSFGVSSQTQMLLDAEREGLVPGGAVRMVPMCDATCGLPPNWFGGREVYVFNIVKHLGRTFGPGRIATRTLIESFARALPACRPVLATHDLAEIKRMGEALAAMGASGGPR